jgi:hypothetical protein
MHDLSDPVYFFLNMFGIALGFVVVALIIRLTVNLFKAGKEKNEKNEEKTLV